MADIFTRHPENPIVRPGIFDWRLAVTFNPGVIRDDDGTYLMYERAAGKLRPFQCYIGLLRSDDGVHFTQVGTEPVFTPKMAGSEFGSVQDPRVVKIDGIYLMTYAFRPYAWNSSPTGVSVPESWEAEFPGFDGDGSKNMTRTGLATSNDGISWRHESWLTSKDIDDRDVILFPEKINGKYWLLRRPQQWVGESFGTKNPSIWISSSEDLQTWSEPTLFATAEQPWEGGRIGGAGSPVKTAEGWLMLYHGVEYVRQIPWVKAATGPAANLVCYRVGAMLLDADDPAKILGRTKDFIMEPAEYYEKFGLYIPNVIFPTANVVLGDTLQVYYGACDTAICLATANLKAILDCMD